MFTSQVISLAEQYLSKPVETYITMKYVRVRTWFDILKSYERIFLSRHLWGKGWRIDPFTVFFSF